MQTLKKENSGSSQTNLQTLAELMHCLMYQHTGFPELYGPVVDCLQVLFWKSNRLVGDVITLTKDTKSLKKRLINTLLERQKENNNFSTQS